MPHWKLVTEGDGLHDDLANRCERDVVPAGPVTDLCALLDADPDHDCTVVHLPAAPHCAYYNTHLGEVCLDWFATLPRAAITGRAAAASAARPAPAP